MRHRPVIVSVFALFAAISVMSVSSMELSAGIVKLVVNDITGRVAFYRLAEVGRNRYEPLLFDQDSRTTFPTLLLDSRYYRLGESPEFRFSLSRITDGVIVFFKSASCVVRQRIELVKSEGATAADTFRMSFDIENHGSQDIRVGFRMLLDTWLGEESGQHFSTSNQSKVTEEMRILKESAERSITSPGEYATLRIDVVGGGITQPDEIVLANWKRLSDSDWSFEASGLRGFSFAPFSINDSAVALYWFSENLALGAVRKLSCNLVSLPGKAQVSRSTSDMTKAASAPLITAKPADPQAVGVSTDNLSLLSSTGAPVEQNTVLSPSVIGPTVISPVAPSASTPISGAAPMTGTSDPVKVTNPARTTSEGGIASAAPASVPSAVSSTAVISNPVTGTPTEAISATISTGSTSPMVPAVASLAKMNRDVDLAELWALLGKINDGIKNPGSVTEDQLAEWKRRLTILQARL